MSSSSPHPDAISLLEAADPDAFNYLCRVRNYWSILRMTSDILGREEALRLTRPEEYCLPAIVPCEADAYLATFFPLYEKLRSGELQATVLSGTNEPEIIHHWFWQSLRFSDVDWESGVIFPKTDRALYGVHVKLAQQTAAPPAAMSKTPNGAGDSATKRRPGPKPDKCDAVVRRMREDVEKNGSTDFLKNMKVELLVEHYGKPASAKRTTCIMARKRVLKPSPTD